MNAHPKRSLSTNKRLCVMEAKSRCDRPCVDKMATVEMGREIIFDAKVLDAFDVKGFLPVHYDLLVICAAIEFADRHWKRPQAWNRTLNVTVPVTEYKIWQRPDVLANFQGALRYLTGDSWQFTFVQAKNLSPVGWRQTPLNFAKAKTFAVPYSDGLDSRAVSALSGDNDEALCVRVGNKRQSRKEGDSLTPPLIFLPSSACAGSRRFSTRSGISG